MAVITINFDSPKSGTTEKVYVHGNTPAGFTGNLNITLLVAGATSTPRAVGTGTYVRAIPLTNSATTAASYTGTYNLAVVPKVLTGQVVTATWGIADVQ